VETLNAVGPVVSFNHRCDPEFRRQAVADASGEHHDWVVHTTCTTCEAHWAKAHRIQCPTKVYRHSRAVGVGGCVRGGAVHNRGEYATR
jgi:hypothetical protein